MGHHHGGETPYATAILITGLAVPTQQGQHQEVAAYVQGKLALAGVDESRTSAATWLNMVYAIVCEAPDAEVMRKIWDKIALQGAIAAPDRATWGMDPEQVQLGRGLTDQR